MSFDYSFPLVGSVQGAILDGIVSKIQQLALPCIASKNIVARCLSWDLNLEPPYLIVRPAPEIIDPNAGSNERAQVNYAYIVSMVAANTADGGAPVTLFGLPLFWRERVRIEFQNKSHAYWRSVSLPLAGSIINRSYVMDGEPFLAQALERGIMAQYLAIRVNTTEPMSA